MLFAIFKTTGKTFKLITNILHYIQSFVSTTETPLRNKNIYNMPMSHICMHQWSYL